MSLVGHKRTCDPCLPMSAVTPKAAIACAFMSTPDGSLAGVVVLSDPDAEIKRLYGAAGPSAFLIRPDGHIAARIPLRRPEAVDALPGLQAIAIGA